MDKQIFTIQQQLDYIAIIQKCNCSLHDSNILTINYFMFYVYLYFI